MTRQKAKEQGLLLAKAFTARSEQNLVILRFNRS